MKRCTNCLSVNDDDVKKCKFCGVAFSKWDKGVQGCEVSYSEPKEEIETIKKHPLLNPDSKHYAMFDGIEAVERLEQMYSKEDLMAWAKISAMKYRLRVGHKDDSSKEVNKIKTFEDYFVYLKELNELDIQTT